jgi:glycosyltransferase involved in cell wall biosynthesis
MKIIWLTNVIPKFISELFCLSISNTGGWLDNFSQRLINDSKHELIFISRYKYKLTLEKNNIKLYTFTKSQKNIGQFFSSIISINKPNLVHIWGTEFIHSNLMVKTLFNFPNIKYVISIQGLISEISKVYLYGINFFDSLFFSFYDLFTGGPILFKMINFYKRGLFEIDTLKKTKYVIGRTNWDFIISKKINNLVHYFHCNESLRNSFYYDNWNYNTCEPFTVFISQINYSIKGFHILLVNLHLLVDKYPLLKIYVTGKNILESNMFNSSYYNILIKKLIIKKKLKNNIVFLGSLNELQMKAQYLKSNIFLCPSLIENSSNSIAEAMILGVPIVSTNVGGISSYLSDKKTSLFYDIRDPKSLYNAIDKIFSNKEYASFLSNNAREIAKTLYDQDFNFQTLLTTYSKIIKGY